MWALVSRVIVQVLAALVVGWRRDRELKASGAREAELRGLEDVNERAAKANAAARRARADPDLLRDDGWRRD
jgi:hypothetical protein